MHNKKVKYKDFGDVWGLANIEKVVNKFLEENPGIEVIMFDRHYCNGLACPEMFYLLPEKCPCGHLESEHNQCGCNTGCPSGCPICSK